MTYENEENFAFTLLRSSYDWYKAESFKSCRSVVELQDQKNAGRVLSDTMVAMTAFANAFSLSTAPDILTRLQNELSSKLQGLIKSCDRLEEEGVFAIPTEAVWESTKSSIESFTYGRWQTYSQADVDFMQTLLTQMKNFAETNLDIKPIGTLAKIVDAVNRDISLFVVIGGSSTATLATQLDAQTKLIYKLVEAHDIAAQMYAKISVPDCEFGSLLSQLIGLQQKWISYGQSSSEDLHYDLDVLNTLQASYQDFDEWLNNRLESLDMEGLVNKCSSEIMGEYKAYGLKPSEYGFVEP